MTMLLRRCVALVALVALLAGPTGAADAPLDRASALSALVDPDVEARRRGAFALADTGAMADVPALIGALGEDEDALVRAIAERAIWALWSRSGDPAADALLAEGMDQMAAHRFPESIATFTRIVERLPDFAEGWNKRATARFLAGDLDGSAADCNQVLQRNPWHFGALSGYGLIHMKQGRLNAALDAFERALALNPNMIGVRANVEAIREELARRREQRT
jgi:tetratricopeptide (TPR) repeat protein